jgi:hypothetical protein
MIRKKQNDGKLKIDLTGPEGNAFFLLGTANNLARQLGLDASLIHSEMISGDYERLVQIFDKYFGGYVILYR